MMTEHPLGAFPPPRPVIEHRACLVAGGDIPERPSWDQPTFSTEQLEREVADIGYKVIDIQRLRDMLTAFINERRANDANIARGPACPGCAYIPLHHWSCPVVAQQQPDGGAA